MNELDVQIRKKKGPAKKRGWGFLGWERLQQRLREAGELTDQQIFHKIHVTSEGIHYYTKIDK